MAKKKYLIDSNENVSFLDHYYDKKLTKIFILVAFATYIKSYNY